MKKFSLKTKENYPRSWKISIAGIILVLVLGFLLPGLISALGSVVAYPLHQLRIWWHESSYSLPVFIREKQDLLSEIHTLERQLSDLYSTNLSVRRLQEENQALRGLLNIESTDRIAARILARPNQLPYDVIQLDRGRVDGVVLHAPVFYGVDQVIGFISHVARDYAFVTLVTSPGKTATAYVVGPNIYTTTEGVGNGMLRVRVPQGVALEIGNLVILPAVSSGVFGEIVHVETAPTQPQRYGYVPLRTPLQGIRYVTVGAAPITPRSFSDVESEISELVANLFTVSVPDGLLITATGTATTSQPLEEIEQNDI